MPSASARTSLVSICVAATPCLSRSAATPRPPWHWRHCAPFPTMTTRWCWWCHRTTKYRRQRNSGRRLRRAFPRPAPEGLWCSASSQPNPRQVTDISRSGRKTAVRSTCRVLSRNRIWRRQKAILRPAISTGMPASFCSAPAPCAMRSCHFVPTYGKRRRLRSMPPPPMCPVFTWRSIYTRQSRPSRSTTRSWSGRATSPWCRPGSAGTTSARGSRCSMSARPTWMAMSLSATLSPSTAKTPTSAAKAVCCPRSV